MELEVVIQNGQDAIEAERLGVDRLELVSAIGEGGLTPSYGTIKQVLASVSIPVYIMVRPHSNHYHYQEGDLEIIHEDIKKIAELGGKNIVFGALNTDNTINDRALEKVIALAPTLSITFHRAFDETVSVMDAYRTLAKYKDHVHSILTSGGASNCQDGKENLRELVKESKKINGPQVMPGSGLHLNNIERIHQIVHANQYHFGKGVRINQFFSESFYKGVVKELMSILKVKT